MTDNTQRMSEREALAIVGELGEIVRSTRRTGAVATSDGSATARGWPRAGWGGSSRYW